MASLTLKGIPKPLMDELRHRAKQERRSLNQQAILLLEQALQPDRPGFTEALDRFVQVYGSSPLDDEVFEALRSPDEGRPVASP